MKAAELCAGYGGLALAVEQVFGAETAWFSEFEAAPSRILAHHWPTTPNHGDMTKIDWTTVEPVDIISGGTPCQDLSHAGRRAGMNDGTRSNLWVQMREAIAVIKPTYVVWENVRGAYSAEANSELEHCTGCMGDTTDRGTVLRALGRVLGDLSDLGYDCQWRGLRAADVGAPHGRYRVFVLATHRDGGRSRRRATLTSNGETPGADAPAHGASSGPSEPRAVSAAPPTDANHPGRGEQRRTIPVQSKHSTTEYAGSDAANTDHERGDGRGQRAKQDGRGQLADSRQPTAVSSGVGGREGWPEHARLERRPDAVVSGDAPTANWGEYGPVARSTVSGCSATNATGGLDANTPESRPAKKMQSVRRPVTAKALRQEAGRPDAIPSEGALRSGLREQPGSCASGFAPMEGSADQASGKLRDLFDSDESSRSSQRQEPREQLAGEPGCVVRKLPPETPLGGGQGEPVGSEPNWGEYEPAIRRWEMVLGRKAPAPTEATGRNGAHRLSARFAEFMMGVPDGWIVDVPGVSRNEALKAAGNGVVVAQAVAALEEMLYHH